MGNREWETGNSRNWETLGMGNGKWETGNSRNWETLGNLIIPEARETESGPELETSWTRLDLLDYMGVSCPVCETLKRNTIPEAKDSGCPS
jgi:hypothetical protein